MAFTRGTATFTNGSKNVTGVSLTVGTTNYFASGTRVVVGQNPVVAVVEATAAPTQATITLAENWPLPSGSYSFEAEMTTEGLRDASQRMNTAVATLQNVSTSAYANSIAQRTSAGRLKVAASSAADDAVNRGELGDSAFLESYKGYGLGVTGNGISILPDTQYAAGIYRDSDSGNGFPVFGWAASILNMKYSASRQAQIGVSNSSAPSRISFRSQGADNTWDGPYELHHSGNANFNEFVGNAANDVIAEGKPFSGTTAIFYLDINKVNPPSSISPIGSATFRVVSTWSASVIATNISFASLSLQSASSNKKARVVIGGLAGLSENSHLELQVINANTGILVND